MMVTTRANDREVQIPAGHLLLPGELSIPGKALGVIAVLAPRLVRLKEWAYAGLVFDLTGALYSHLSVGDSLSAWIFPIIGLLLVGGSYLFYRQRLTDEGRSVGEAVVPHHGDHAAGGIPARET